MTDKLFSSLGEKFSFELKNTTGSTTVIAILAAFFDTLKLTEGAPNTLAYTNATEVAAAGYTCNHVMDDGTLATNITATAINSKMKIRAFREYIKCNSRVVKKMSVQVDSEAAFNSTIEIVNCSPLTGDKSSYLPLSSLRNQYGTLATYVEFDTPGLVIGFDTLMLLPVLAGRTYTITFWF